MLPVHVVVDQKSGCKVKSIKHSVPNMQGEMLGSGDSFHAQRRVQNAGERGINRGEQ